MSQQNPQLIRTSIIVVIIAAAIGVLTVMTAGAGSSDGMGKVFLCCFALIIFGITGTICLVASEKQQYKGLGIAGMICSAVGYLLTVFISLGAIGDESIMKIAGALFIASIALAHISLLHHFNLRNKYAVYARITATIAISIFSLILITRIFEPFYNMYALAANQSILKLAVAALMVDLAATILVPLCNRLEVEYPSVLELENDTAVANEEQSVS